MALTIEKAQQILDDYYDLTHTKYDYFLLGTL